jgi:tetratricopeptide (TPR) repeat protein
LAEARALLRQRRLHEAARAFASALDARRCDVGGWLEYGGTLSALEDYAAALAAFDTALSHRPGFVAAWNDRGVALQALGRIDESRKSFERAVQLQPGFAAAIANLANLELASADLERAEALYRQALRNDAASVAARIGLGRTLWRLRRHAEARRELERALDTAPSSFDALLALVVFQLDTTRLSEALAACDRFLRLSPGHSGALGLRAEVGRECRDESRGDLLDLGRWLSVRDLPADPRLHGDLTGLLTAQLPLNAAPPHHATQRGLRSGPLSSLDHPVLARLEALVEREIFAYVSERKHERALSLRRPTAVALHMWGVVLRGDGFQLPHLHPEAWLSGVYYVAVPSRTTRPAGNRAGCLEFGTADPALNVKRGRASHFVEPIPGRLVLFPSWLYHSTVPHRAQGLRISIAFDCVAAH